jgi:hypothetical protein
MKTVMIPDLTEPEPELEKQLFAKVKTLADVIGLLD